MKYWFFVLLWPMLFIGTTTTCSWNTCIIDMLVTHSRNWKEMKTMQQMQGEEFELCYTTCMED
jgi:hypothetical protein